MAADQKEELLKSVKNTLRSVLIPSKEGIPARTIERVYDELACSPLPYRQLGFNSCEEFIRSIPDVVRIGRNKDGGPQLFAVATAATAHIVKMVSAQRNKKVRSKRPVKTPVRRPYNQKPGPPPRPYQSRYGYTGKPAYQSSRPLSRPIGKPFRKPSRPTGRNLYNNNSNMGQPHRSAPSYSAPSGASYTNFAVTVQSNRGGNSVELRYDSDDSENETGKQGRMRSVVVKPALLPNPNLRSQNPNNEEVKFGENFEVPPRLRNSRGGRGEKDHLPSGYNAACNNYANQSRAQRAYFVERGQLYKKLVIDYCNQKNLQFPDYATVAMKKGYVSSIILEGRSYGSLEPYQTPESAEEATALNACKSLNIEKGVSAAKETEPTQPDQPLTCDPKVKDRIVQIVRRRQTGTWLKRVPVEYKEKYREECPANLLRLLQSWPDLVRAEKIESADTYIVYPAAPKVDIPMAALFDVQERVAVYMSYLSGDGHFYVHRADTDIDNINQDIQCLSETASRIPGPELTPGDYCVAKYAADDTWCRARILQYVPGTDTVDVLFVDYGNEEQIALQSIRQLNPKLSIHPAQSIKCELYGAKSWQGDLWSEKAIEKFADVCGNVELMALTISHSDNMCVVELYNSGGDEQSINELMVRQGLLKPTAEKLLRLVPEKTDKTTGNGEMTETEEHQDGELPAVTPPLGKPGPLQFPDERYWDVYVSFLTSIKDITFRLVGENYSVKLEELEVSLKDCYGSAAVTSGEEIVEGSVCVASVDGLYHRVRVLNREGNKAKCFFLDHGDTDEMDIQNLRLISADFNTLPYQACHCELHGLELTSEALTALALETLLNYVLGKTCVAEVVTSYGRHHSVVLFDTSGEEDVNINDAIAKLTAEENTKCVQFVKSGGYLLMGPYDIPTPCDDQLSVTSESSSISSSGRQEVVIVKPKFLKYQMNRESAFNDAESVSSECSSTSEMSITLKPKFHTKSTTNQSARNPNASADSNLLAIGDLQLSESGDSANFSDVASSSTMSSLDTSLGQPCSIEPAMLQQFSQGINQESIVGTTLSPGMSQGKSRPSTTEDRSDVHPEDMPLPESCSDFSSASDLDQGLSLGSGMPGISSWDGKTSDIHRKVSTTKSQTPVNAATSYAPQGAWSFPADMDIWGKEYLSLPLPPFLQPPPVGQYMDVRVRWASDPENFVCLPYNTLQQFTEFTESLQKYFEENPPARTPRMEEIQAGHLYAGRQCGTWYRVIVKDFLQDTDLVCILMADIGEFDVMSLSDLHPLPLQFWRIPFQAIRAKLHGVTCAASKSWSEATKFKFLELVLDKDLVAMVQAKDDSAGVVSLDLVDTSQENQDICINDIFISKLLSWTDS